jgi:hypothetical protein
MSKGKGLQVFLELKKGTTIVLNESRRDKPTMGTLSERLRCSNEDLTNGSLTFEGVHEENNILVGQRGSTKKISVHFKFFIPFEDETPQQELQAA